MRSEGMAKEMPAATLSVLMPMTSPSCAGGRPRGRSPGQPEPRGRRPVPVAAARFPWPTGRHRPRGLPEAVRERRSGVRLRARDPPPLPPSRTPPLPRQRVSVRELAVHPARRTPPAASREPRRGVMRRTRPPLPSFQKRGWGREVGAAPGITRPLCAPGAGLPRRPHPAPLEAAAGAPDTPRS